jgi:hypothetical protein
MVNKRPVDRYELQAFDLALRQQQPVEWIARSRLRLGSGDDMRNVYQKDRKPSVFQNWSHIDQRDTGIKLTKPRLGGGFPKAATLTNPWEFASENNLLWRGNWTANACRKNANTKCVSSRNLIFRAEA